MTVVQRSPKAGIQVSGGALLSGVIHTLPSPPWRGHPQPTVNLLGEGGPGAAGRHLLGEATTPLPSCPVMRRRASRGVAGDSSREASTPCRPPLCREAAAAYRHAREGGHPGSGGALLSGGIHTLRRPPWGVIHTLPSTPWRGRHTLPSTPSGRPPQPTVMPAKAGIQGLAGHSSREVSTPSVNLLGEASIPPVNLLGEASISCLRPLRGGRHSLPSCPRRRASSGLGGTRLGRQQSSRSGTL